MLIFSEILVKNVFYGIIIRGDIMPASYTHHVFTQDIFKSLDNTIKEKIEKSLDLFYLFGKSFDILFFVDIKMGNYAHKNNVNLYFKNIIQCIINNNLENNSEVLAYLYGSICHYVLDSVCHPYVFYKTGNYNFHDKNTYKYRGEHSYLEYMVDAIIYQTRNNKPIYKAKLATDIFSSVKFSKELQNALNYTYYNTFKVSNYSKKVYRGYKNYRNCLKYFMCSRWGIKKRLYNFIDCIRICNIELAPKCYYIKKLDMRVLNLEHKEWCYPVAKKELYHYSFYDLYDIALIRAKKMIIMIDDFLLKKEQNLDVLLKEIGNLSYITGVDLRKPQAMKYFEF